MKTKKSDILICVIFLAFVFGMLGMYLLLPGQNFSEKEKRYLAESPQLTWETLLSGEFGQDVETTLPTTSPAEISLWVLLLITICLADGRSPRMFIQPRATDW